MQQERHPKFARSPLKFVLVQVRFSPVKMMTRYVPLLQEQLRKDGFPRHNAEQIQQFKLGDTSPATTCTRWSFINRERSEAIVLAEDYIVYETNRYTSFEHFRDRLENFLNLLHSHSEISFVTQIGLRYIDLILQIDEHPPEWFIRQEFRGLLPDSIGAREVINQSTSHIVTDEGLLRLRSFEGTGPQFMPPDLVPPDVEAARLKFAVELSREDRFRVLDFDHVSKDEFDFSVSDILDRVSRLHAFIGKTFRATVTKEALAVWERGSDEQH